MAYTARNTTNLLWLIGATVLTLGCCFVNQAIADGEVHSAKRHHGHVLQPEAGWGWDNRSGWYAGPFYSRAGHGYFRCFDPGYGWHTCPHYLPANAAPKPPRGWWRLHFIGGPAM